MSGGRVRLGRAAARALWSGALVACLWIGTANAQTTVNPQALDQLAPAPPKATTHPRPKRPPRHPAVRHPAPPAATKPATPSAPPGGGKPNPHAELPGSASPARGPAKAAKPAMPVVPAAPPPVAVLPPPIVVPTRPVPPPPPVPVVAGAPGEAMPEKDGLRVTFGAGRSDLNPATDAALRGLAHGAAPSAPTTFSVTAYAAGNADDPSTPRRLALARALAVRSVLIAEGIPSARIYVKALGASVPPGDAPVDRVDVAASAPAQPARQGTAP